MAGRMEDAGKKMAAAEPALEQGQGSASKGGGRVSSSSKSSEKVEQMMARLRLTAVESTAVVIDDREDLDLVDPDRAFVGKVLAPNKLHVQTISSALRPAWGNPKGLTFNPSGDNHFVAEFGSKADRDRVMEGSPWTVGRHAVLMKKYDTEVQPQMVVFDRFAIWARILALPNRLMNSTHGLEIAKPIGLVRRVECDDLGRCWGTFMRLRVEVKVDEPLVRIVTVFSSKLQASECFAVQYEKLPIYCFSCGLLGHSTLVCSTPAERDENDDLSYSAKKLMAPEEHKKSGGSWSGNASAGCAQSASGSKNSTAGQDAQSNVRVRLDRAMCNNLFVTRFANCYVENVITTSSDHYDVVLAFENQSDQIHRLPVQMAFRYEAMWCRAEDYGATVEQAWEARPAGAKPVHSAWDAMHHMAGFLQKWSKISFGAVRRNIQRLERSLKMLRQSAICQEVLEKERDLERQLCELFEREEIMAKQRSRVEWLKEGDRNTAFFHARASARKKNNRIDSLVRDDGSKCDDVEGIKGMVHEFYEQLFTSEVIPSMEEVLEAILAKVSDQMNEHLCSPYSDEEIRSALFQMGPTKAPGLMASRLSSTRSTGT
ncbi:hypothetical protein ACQ4PT_023338 [Festuca glaucescens]